MKHRRRSWTRLGIAIFLASCSEPDNPVTPMRIARRLDSLEVAASYTLDAVNEVPNTHPGGGFISLLAKVATCTIVSRELPESTWVGPPGTIELERAGTSKTFSGSYRRIRQCGDIVTLSPNSYGWSSGGYAVQGHRGETVKFFWNAPTAAGTAPFTPFTGVAKASGRSFAILTNGDTLPIADTLRIGQDGFTLRFVAR